ncbi:Alpha/Beta hydrolase protein [Hyaloraphidium curvatum]|nr:Alpha/Beta hydrolase protein [Hyaloraphidium curvatum]
MSSSSASAPETHLFRTSLGTDLAFSIFGDARSPRTFVHCHGYPGSRLEAGLFADHAPGIRIVGVDRPGYGASQAWPADIASSPELLSKHWPAIIAELLVHIAEVHTTAEPPVFGASGLSGGGPYALSLALHLPARIRALLLVVPWTPPTRRESYAVMGWLEYFSYVATLSDWTSWLTSALYAFVRRGISGKPADVQRKIVARAFGGPSDAAALLDDAGFGRAFATQFAEGLRPGTAPEAAVHDGRALFSPWGFEPEQLNAGAGGEKIPVAVFAGDADGSCSLDAIRNSYGRIDGAEKVEVYGGMGHIAAIRACREDAGRAMGRMLA